MNILNVNGRRPSILQAYYHLYMFSPQDRFPVTHEMNVNNKVGLAAEEWCIRELDNIVYAERDPPAWLADKLVSLSKYSSRVSYNCDII